MSDYPGDTLPTRRGRDMKPTQPAQPDLSRAEAARQRFLAQQSGAQSPPPPPKRHGRLGRFFSSPGFVVALAVFFGLLFITAASAAAGWTAGRADLGATATVEAGFYLYEQYNQAVADIEAENYELALERLEFIFAQDPEFLDVADLWVQVQLVLGHTSSGGQSGLPTNTPTPTPDPRPKEELLAAAQAHIAAREWTQAIDTLLSLRQADPAFHTVEVDGLLYLALRNRGAANIVQNGLFEPGLYDFSLAVKFGPLDGQAVNYREWARLYLYGNAFWYAYPEEAAYYYGQLVNMVPDLRDSSGLSAFYRYWQSLVHIADRLAADEEWCDAMDAYQQALNARPDNGVQPTASYVTDRCIELTPSATPLPSATNTLLATFTPTFTGTPGPTNTPGPTATFISTPTTGPTSTTGPTNTPTLTNTPAPTATFTPTFTPTDTLTPTP